MSDKRWNATKRALARHAMHIPDEHHVDPGLLGGQGGDRSEGFVPYRS